MKEEETNPNRKGYPSVVNWYPVDLAGGGKGAGPIEASGVVNLCDLIYTVNGSSTQWMTCENLLPHLRARPLRLGFAAAPEPEPSTEVVYTESITDEQGNTRDLALLSGHFLARLHEFEGMLRVRLSAASKMHVVTLASRASKMHVVTLACIRALSGSAQELNIELAKLETTCTILMAHMTAMKLLQQQACQQALLTLRRVSRSKKVQIT